MTYYRVTLAMIGMSIFVVCGQGSQQAAGQVRVDVGPVHVHVGDGERPPVETVEVLTRGPVHEAFAQPVIFDEGAAFSISRQPPPPLDEIVPDQKPEGNHIVWIPGYWGWDGDRNDFLWVSGCWRAVPPNTSWVPGYWAQGRGGYQWVAGFWTTANTEEIEYLPAPPATLEEGPPAGGSPDNIWISGCWIRQENRYAWRPGFWEPARANWAWEPSHYISTPRGYIYVDGYWDYPLERRGVAFLPVYCPASLYGREGFRYSPDMVLDLGVLTLNLFSSPQRHHYYFGDYYGAEYAREDFHPWYEASDHHNWYDPIFVHQQWQHRDDHQWIQHEREGYDHRRDDTSLRPARTYEAMTAQVARLPEKDRRQAQMARPMKEVVATKTTPYKFQTLDAKTREATASQAKETHAYKDTRAKWESPAAAPKTGLPPKEAVVTPKETVVAPKEAVVAPKETITPKEPVRTPANELPKEPAKEVTPVQRPLAPDHGTAVKEAPTARDVQPEKVKIPKPPVTVREPVQDKELVPPPRPEHPKPDLNAKPKAEKIVTPDRSKEAEGPDKSDPTKK